MKLFFFSPLLIIIFIYSCTFPNNNQLKKIKDTRLLMDTFVEITVFHESKRTAHKAIDAAFNEMKKIKDLMSKYEINSDISKLNQNTAAIPQEVAPEVYHLINKAVYYSKITKGKFDITVGVLTGKLWDFNKKNKFIPPAHEIKKLLPLVNYKNILLFDKNRIQLKEKGMLIDAGGIAKGYAVDMGIETLRKKGVINAIINAGGDLRAIGNRGKNKPWRIGIQHPRDSSQIFGILEVNDLSVATSGDYQKYFIKEGKRYNHLIDPSTGWPANKNRSVTITAQDALDADALATAVFIMSPKEGINFIEKNDNVEGLIITSNGKVLQSSGMKVEPEE